MKKLLSILFVSIIFMSCDTGQSTHGVNDPKDVLTRFFKALSEKNIPEAKKYVTADSEGMINMMQMSFDNMEAPVDNEDQFDPSKVDIADAQIKGDIATVRVTEKQSGESTNFTLKKEEGEWRIAFDMGTLYNMAAERIQQEGTDVHKADSLLKNLSKEDAAELKKYTDTIQNLLNNVSEEDWEKAKKFLENHPDLKKGNAEEMREQLKKLKKQQ